MKCRKCGTVGEWNFSEYSWRKYKWCLSCLRRNKRECMERVRANFLATHGIEYKDYTGEWQQANYAKCRVVRERYRKANMEKCRAQVYASRAFPDREICSMEGCADIGERHHPDYSKPYEIDWLCRKHHKALCRI